MNSLITKSATETLFKSLCKANIGILNQKLSFLDELTSNYDPHHASKLYTSTCPIVKASIGQHIRHSMDHIERAALAVKQHDTDKIPEIYYDVRERGCLSETNIDESKKRIITVSNLFHNYVGMNDTYSNDQNEVIAYFTLLSDDNGDDSSGKEPSTSIGLHSTIGRELGFGIHHAIHHLAMIKVIAIQQNIDNFLPDDFGRAPSTIEFLRQQ